MGSQVSKTICVPNFAKIAQSAVRYHYFRFLKASGRRIEILLPVCTLAFSSLLAYDSASAYQIPSRSDHLRRSYDVIVCQDGERQPCWICSGVMLDHPWSVVDGCCYILKFWLDRSYSFGDSAILHFHALAWICLFTPAFGGYWGTLSRNDVIYRPTPKRHWNTSFES